MSLSQKIALKYVKTKFGLLSSISKRKAAEKAFALFCTPQRRVRKKPLPVFGEGEKIQFNHQENIIKGYRWNPSDKKILILHGYESSILNFGHYVKPLVKKGYEVLGFDAMAHGASSGKMINVLLYKQLILDIINKWGPIQNFIAHSLGGLALSMALEELQHTDVYKAVLIAPATETVTASDHYFKLLNLDLGVRKEFDAIIMEKSGHPPTWFSAARASSNIKAKVLWAHDKNDDLTPYTDIEKVIEANHSNYSFLITEGLGHRRIYKDAKVVGEVVNFF
ncbi:MAG TPA: alpha/beta hydrolase [Chitinophagaceae bacterium]|jgi:pimeloyl-ACP methyl ester carboxylesterase|nr:alpha/beta hydrolase [Chitinophagaceae bacterium]